MVDGEEEDLVDGFLLLDVAQFLGPVLVDLLVLQDQFVPQQLVLVGLLDALDAAQTGVHVAVDLVGGVVGIAHIKSIEYALGISAAAISLDVFHHHLQGVD